ncbi:MAG TPA: outer membrane beta-barrel protein [Longimicrobiales bacterium]|nr:outer membrane beta-barrel protein [Longimicrobiales bacterium]
MRLRELVGIGMFAAVIPMGGIAGQVDYSSLELSIGYAGWTGDAGDGFDPGIRGQFNLFGGVSSTFAVALTGTWADVPFAEVDTDATEWGVGVTLRKALGRAGQTRAFVDGSVGWTRLTTAVEDVDVDTDGFAIGPGLGVEIPLGSRLKAIGRGSFHYHDYGDVLVNSGIPASDGFNGWRWAAYAGLSFGPLR